MIGTFFIKKADDRYIKREKKRNKERIFNSGILTEKA